MTGDGNSPPPPSIEQATLAQHATRLKGVRIGFDAGAWSAAEVEDEYLDRLETALRQASSPEEVRRLIRGAGAYVAGRVLERSGERMLASPVVVSVGHLVSATARYRDRWDELPEELRHPGNLRRIGGFILRPNEEDLLIIGTDAGAGKPIDIDDLILGLRASWRNGDEPFCSLEPDPYDMTGVHRAVVSGVPHDSHFAKVMLEADYELKRLILGDRTVDVPGFVSIPRAADEYVARHGSAAWRKAYFGARWWFVSVPPDRGTVLRSRAAGIYRFEAAMQVLSKLHETLGGKLVDLEGMNPIQERVVTSLNRELARLELMTPEFRQLHSLYDIVTLGGILRKEGIDAKAIRELVELPCLSVPPRVYRGIQTSMTPARIVVAGGVNMRVHLASDSILGIEDERVDAFVNRVDGDRACARLNDIEVPMPRVAARNPRRSSILRIWTLIGKGEHLEAVREATRLMERNPQYEPAYAFRALACAARELYWLAERDLETLREIGAESLNHELMRYSLLILRGDITRPDQVPEAIRRDLATRFMHSAFILMGIESYSLARRDAERAAALTPASDEARGVLLLTHLVEGTDAGLACLNKELEFNPELAELRLHRGWIRFQRSEWEAAKTDLDEVIRARPSLANAQVYFMRACATVQADELATDEAYADLQRASQLDPDTAIYHWVRATILLAEGDRQGAIAACKRALAVSPTESEAYAVRAKIRFRDAILLLRNGKVAEDELFLLMRDLSDTVHLESGHHRARLMRADIAAAVAHGLRTRRPKIVACLEDESVWQELQRVMQDSSGPAVLFDIEPGMPGEKLTDRIAAILYGAAAVNLERAAEVAHDPKLAQALMARSRLLKARSEENPKERWSTGEVEKRQP